MTGSVKGRVLTRERMPVAGATVFIVKGPGPAPDIAPISDDSGRFVLDGLGEGTYTLRAFGPAQEAGEASVSIHAGSVTNTEIVLPK